MKTIDQKKKALKVVKRIIEFYTRFLMGDMSVIKKKDTGLCHNLTVYLNSGPYLGDNIGGAVHSIDRFGADVVFPIEGDIIAYENNRHKYEGQYLTMRQTHALNKIKAYAEVYRTISKEIKNGETIC